MRSIVRSDRGQEPNALLKPGDLVNVSLGEGTVLGLVLEITPNDQQVAASYYRNRWMRLHFSDVQDAIQRYNRNVHVLLSELLGNVQVFKFTYEAVTLATRSEVERVDYMLPR